MKTIVYDGTFEGFLTAYLNRPGTEGKFNYVKQQAGQTTLFELQESIVTDRQMARSLWQKIEGFSTRLSKLIYFSFMTEEVSIEQKIACVLDDLMGSNKWETNTVLAAKKQLEFLYNKVNAEKERLQREFHFLPTGNGEFIAKFQPAYNTLPLITRHLKSKYPGLNWIILDMKRKYGIEWSNNTLQYIHYTDWELPRGNSSYDKSNPKTLISVSRNGADVIIPHKNPISKGDSKLITTQRTYATAI